MKHIIKKILNKFGYYNSIDVYYLDKQKGMRVWSTFLLLDDSNKLTFENGKIRKYVDSDKIKQDKEYSEMYKI